MSCLWNYWTDSN